MILNYFTIGLGLFGLCSVMLPLLIAFSERKGFLDAPSGRKRHQKPTPFTGGWLIFCGFWVGLAAFLFIDKRLALELNPFLPYIALAHLLIFLGGALDDVRDLSAVTKLLIQLAAAAILFIGGLSVDTIYVPFTGSFPLHPVVSFLVTAFWLLAIINALNIIDGMDGLAAGLSVIAGVGLLYTSIALQIPVVAAISSVTIAVLLAFLRFNFPPARIFLGDSGSQSLGFIFAVIAIYCPVKSYTVVAMFIPLLALGVPLIELAMSFTRRLLTGRSVMKADLGHLYHVLTRRGLSQVQTLLIFWGVAAALQVFVFTLFLFDRRVVFSILVLFMLIVAGWFRQLSRKEVR
jgi:UDP-GlcNAc:undecaprenyl-phosphate GlcNAc-1-phosphate transferase